MRKGTSFDDQRTLRKIHFKFYPRVKVDSMSWVMTKLDPFLDKL